MTETRIHALIHARRYDGWDISGDFAAIAVRCARSLVDEWRRQGWTGEDFVLTEHDVEWAQAEAGRPLTVDECGALSLACEEVSR